MMTPPQKDRNWDLKPIPPQEEAAPEELHRNPACEAVRDAHKLQDACAYQVPTAARPTTEPAQS